MKSNVSGDVVEGQKLNLDSISFTPGIPSLIMPDWESGSSASLQNLRRWFEASRGLQDYFSKR